MGLLAVAIGIGAAVAGGTGVASADTTSSNASEGSAQSSTTEHAAADATATKPSRKHTIKPRKADVKDDASDQASATADPEPSTATTKRADRRAARANAEPAVTTLEVLRQPTREAAATVAADPATPAPTDQTSTEYGDIGKWMLQSNGQIADYGGLPYQGKTVLEPVNVIIVDSSSRSAFEATWRLNTAMRKAGFPPRAIHSTGFRALIDGQRYRQQPRGALVGYSDGSFLTTNNHGRIFGPAPVETGSGYVWSGAFSTEQFAIVDGLPRHVYVSSDQARAALATKLVASGQATLGNTIALDNAYNTDTTTTGDHDGNAVVIILNSPVMFGAATWASNGGCSANSIPNSHCATVTLATA